jgi:hypothetical protein
VVVAEVVPLPLTCNLDVGIIPPVPMYVCPVLVIRNFSVRVLEFKVYNLNEPPFPTSLLLSILTVSKGVVQLCSEMWPVEPDVLKDAMGAELTTLEGFSTSKVVTGDETFIPTLPLPLTNNILEEAGESIRSRLAEDAPEMWREADGVIVPIPTLLLGVILNNVTPPKSADCPTAKFPLLALPAYQEEI